MSSAKSLKKMNLLNVIKTVSQNQPITKPEIVEKTGLTNVTVNHFINEMVDHHVITEEGNSVSTGGRNAKLYKMDTEHYILIGVTFSLDTIKIGSFNLNLDIVELETEKYSFDTHSVDESISFLINKIHKFIDQKVPETCTIIGIGVSVPGPTDFKTGVIYRLPKIPQWESIPLLQLLEKEFPYHILVDDDNNCNISCLKWLQCPRDAKNVIYLSSLDGVGVGVLLNGDTYHGHHYLAGEIGHISIDSNGMPCTCGNRGCIELYASNLGIVRQVRSAIVGGWDSKLKDMCGGDLDQITIEMVTEAANAGDKLALEIVRSNAKHVEFCLDIILKTYDPEQVILDFYWISHCDNLFNEVLNHLFEHTLLVNRYSVDIQTCQVEELFVRGAATLILDQQFNLESDSIFIQDTDLED